MLYNGFAQRIRTWKFKNVVTYHSWQRLYWNLLGIGNSQDVRIDLMITYPHTVLQAVSYTQQEIFRAFVEKTFRIERTCVCFRANNAGWLFQITDLHRMGLRFVCFLIIKLLVRLDYAVSRYRILVLGLGLFGSIAIAQKITFFKHVKSDWTGVCILSFCRINYFFVYAIKVEAYIIRDFLLFFIFPTFIMDYLNSLSR